MGVALAAIGRIGSVSPGAEKVEPPRPSCRGNWGPPASVVGPRTPGLGRRDSGVRTRASGLGRQSSGVSPRASVLGRRASVLGRWVSVGRSRSARLGRQPLVVCPRVSVLGRRASVGRSRSAILGRQSSVVCPRSSVLGRWARSVGSVVCLQSSGFGPPLPKPRGGSSPSSVHFHISSDRCRRELVTHRSWVATIFLTDCGSPTAAQYLCNFKKPIHECRSRNDCARRLVQRLICQLQS